MAFVFLFMAEISQLFCVTNSLVCLACSGGTLLSPLSRTSASPATQDCRLTPFNCNVNDTLCLAGSLTFPKSKNRKNFTLSGCHNVEKSEFKSDSNCKLVMEEFTQVSPSLIGEVKFCVCDRDFCNGHYLGRKIYETTVNSFMTTANPDYDEQNPTEEKPEAESRLPLMAKLALFNQQSNALRLAGKKGKTWQSSIYYQSLTSPMPLASESYRTSSRSFELIVSSCCIFLRLHKFLVQIYDYNN